MGTATELRFVYRMMWELLQIKIVRTSSKIVGSYPVIVLSNFLI
ncbi:hypothetical protein LIL_12024 [Leptospira interrogans serovar Linhai str. 56609]|nr:hypothetical protein LIL_12024 [Leptospira interrogans serovar Linhai str. 56609]